MTDTQISDEEWNGLEFTVGVSRRYHQLRCRYFARQDTFISVFSILFSSAAFTSIVTEIGGLVPTIASLMIVLLTSMAAVNRYGEISYKHNELGRLYTRLQHDIASHVEGERSVEIYKDLRARLREIEVLEPPGYMYVLSAVCFNDELVSRGYPKDELIDLSWAQVVFANAFDIGRSKIQQARLK